MSRARDIADGKFANDLTVDTNTLKVDATNNRVFVGATSGDRKFEVHDTGVVVANFKSTGANSLMAFDNSSDTSQNHMIGFSGDDFRVVETTEKIRVLSSGGITFNGDTAAANALDDYEIGSFDPKVFQGGSEVGDAAYNSGFTGGQYTKIGRMVFMTCSLRLTSKGTVTATNTFQIGNLPFVPIANIRARTAVSIFDHVGAGIDTTGNQTGSLQGLLTNSGTISFRLNDYTGTSAETIQFADIGNSLYIQLSFFFETS